MDGSRSLQELDGQDWGEPTYPSHLVTACHRLRRVPLKDLSVEDLRLLLGQQIGPEYLVPLALDHLNIDPFASGQHYPGDLLEMVLLLPSGFWTEHSELRRRAVEVAAIALARFGDRVVEVHGPVAGWQIDLVRRFLDTQSPKT